MVFKVHCEQTTSVFSDAITLISSSLCHPAFLHHNEITMVQLKYSIFHIILI